MKITVEFTEVESKVVRACAAFNGEAVEEYAKQAVLAEVSLDLKEPLGRRFGLVGDVACDNWPREIATA